MEPLKAIASGLAGACVLTLLHETTRRLRPADAPRMDVLGMRAIAKIMRKADQQPPREDTLFTWAMVGDVVGNALYYSLTGTGKGVWARGAALGLAAGIGAVALPGPMGLGNEPSNRTPQTSAMALALYLTGGLVAAAAASVLSASPAERAEQEAVEQYEHGGLLGTS